MKRFILFSGICIGIIALSLLLPYEVHDVYSGGSFTTPSLIKEGVQLAGAETLPAYVPLIAIIIISLVVLIKKNLATAIIGLVMGLGLLLYMPFLAISLTFHLIFFSGLRNSQLHIGFFIAAIAVFIYFVLLIANLVVVVKKRKNKKKEPMSNVDLLDDF
ncbi:MAG: hypothetical protein JKY09_00890 [Crocinitomicaceae bacterium]|nr:hypothetical protein [Crocinitomicaceae bacterium]